MLIKLETLLATLRFGEYYGQALLMASLGLLFVKSYEQNHVVFVMLGVLLACCGLFMFNNIEDAHDDALIETKKSTNPISSHSLNLKQAYLITHVSLFFAVFLFFAVGVNTGILGLSMLLLGVLYSWRRVRLKSIPVLDIVAHSLIASLAFVLGSTAGQLSITPNYFIMFFAVFALSTVGDINNEIRDNEVDRLAKIKNTASMFDLNLKSVSKLLSLITIIACLYIYFSVFVWLISNLRFMLFGLCLLFAADIVILTKKHSAQVYQYPKRNLLYFSVSLIIWLNLLSM